MTIKLKPEVKVAFLAALRSGEYKQGFGCLVQRHTDGTLAHCCLGVLTDLAVKAGIGQWLPKPSVHENAIAFSADMSATVGEEGGTLAREVVMWAYEMPDRPTTSDMLSRMNPDVSSGRPLAALNDDGITFERIAYIIEREF